MIKKQHEKTHIFYFDQSFIKFFRNNKKSTRNAELIFLLNVAKNNNQKLYCPLTNVSFIGPCNLTIHPTNFSPTPKICVTVGSTPMVYLFWRWVGLVGWIIIQLFGHIGIRFYNTMISYLRNIIWSMNYKHFELFKSTFNQFYSLI